MNRKYVIAGYRKGSEDCKPVNFNVYSYDEEQIRKDYYWIDATGGFDRMRLMDGKELNLDMLMDQLRKKGVVRCHTDYYCYVFKDPDMHLFPE